ncbi:MAG TPA: hypothetical protein PKZ35_09275 [Gammaproteobacteria bacterium]|nr:hypothetical protein [Gammaproteobacteria bacterium]
MNPKYENAAEYDELLSGIKRAISLSVLMQDDYPTEQDEVEFAALLQDFSLMRGDELIQLIARNGVRKNIGGHLLRGR